MSAEDGAEHEVIDTLTRVLVRACRQLAEAGHPQASGLLAGQAWVVLRHNYSRQAQHIDGVMHHIAKLEAKFEANQSTREVDTMTDERVLDVRTEIPKRRHELIFETFGTLPVDASYVLVNDHDPKPLKYQFEAENTGEFSWEYLEQGPEVWRVRIGRVAAAQS